MLKALIFDVDGTLADTEAAHLRAFNQAFEQEGMDWHWTLAQYTELLAISGGKERMLHHWRQVNPESDRGGGGRCAGHHRPAARGQDRVLRGRQSTRALWHFGPGCWL